ncbi:helix-turn-helix domain-containing protein [Streptomyces sp. NPDC058317]|uniref:helix-turn-helix domain-containing protein n=1 Tax=Streptomyces sp. NPDC058317 TaxID=3346443 RepID=UPI0036E8B10A
MAELGGDANTPESGRRRGPGVPARASAPREVPDGSPEAAALLGEQLRALRERTGLVMRAFVSKYGYSQTTISRYERGGRLPRKAYLDCLLGEVSRRGDPLLTPEDVQTTYGLYRKALGPAGGRNALLLEVFELELRKEQLSVQTTGLYTEAAAYKARVGELEARLAAGGAARPGEREQLRREGAELARRRTELETEQHTVQQRINRLEQLLPLDDEDTALAPPPPPTVPPFVPPGEHGGRPGRRVSVTQWILGAGLAVALTLLTVIAFHLWSPGSTDSPGSSGSSGRDGRAAPPASAAQPSDSGTDAASDPATVGGGGGGDGDDGTSTAPSAGATGWTRQYHDTSITLPPVEDVGCQLASMDFDPPRGYEGSADAISGTPDDLTVQTACVGMPTNITLYAVAWGTSSAGEPGPARCLDDANRNALPRKQALSKITVGSAYCLVTRKQSLAWFKVTAKPGSQQQGLTVVATLWTPPEGS